MFKSLEKSKYKKIWILPNNDPGSSLIKDLLMTSRNDSNLIYENFPREHYLEIMMNSKSIIGNSSSGIIESASFKLPAINIGRRQNNRLKGNNVINVPKVSEKEILKAIKMIDSKNFLKKISKIKNLYGDGKSSERIVSILKNMLNQKDLIVKEMTY